MKKLYTILTLALALSFGSSNAQSFIEEFDDISLGIPAGWDTIQRSTAGGTTDWFQGNVAAIPLYSGAGYIAANYQNCSGTGTISNWLIAPMRMLNNGDKIIFNTSTVATVAFPDRLQVRISQLGASANVGANETTVGDFTMLALDINPTYTLTAYPNAWARYEVILAGLPAFPGVSGRFAFRYYVENAGPTGANSDYIGIDSVYYKDLASSIQENNISSTISLYPNPATDNVNLNFGTGNTMERTVTITDVIGKVVFEQVFTENEFSINVAQLNAGTYMLTTKSDDGVGRKKLIVE